MNKFVVPTAIFFLCLLLATNTQANVFDSVTDMTLGVNFYWTIPAEDNNAGGQRYQNLGDCMIDNSYPNITYFLYMPQTNIGAFGLSVNILRLNKSSGVWQNNSYLISSDTNLIPQYASMVEIGDKLSIFFCSSGVVKEYEFDKNALTSTFIGNVINCASRDFRFIKTKNDDIVGIAHNGSGLYLIKKSNSWSNPTLIAVSSASKVTLEESFQSGDLWINYYIPNTIYTVVYNSSTLMKNGTYTITGNHFFGGSAMKNKNVGMTLWGYSSVAQFYNGLQYNFVGNDTYGINCVPSKYSSGNYIYSCSQTISPAPTGDELYPIKQDWYNNTHFLFINYNGFDSPPYGDPYYYFNNGSNTVWYRAIFPILTNPRVSSLCFDYEGAYLIIIEIGNSHPDILRIYYTSNSVNDYMPPIPVPPIPPATADSTVIGMMCGAGSYFAGTDYSGGCQVASLFLLAIILSVIGWLFKYLKHEYGEEIPDKYLISGVISAIFIIAFIAIGMSDLLTGIMSVVLILTLIVSYSQSFGGGKK